MSAAVGRPRATIRNLIAHDFHERMALSLLDDFRAIEKNPIKNVPNGALRLVGLTCKLRSGFNLEFN